MDNVDSVDLNGMQRSTERSACRHLWKQVWESAFTADATDAERLAYFWGYLTGLAEKVWLGACPAAMVHPSEYWYAEELKITQRVCAIYGLSYEEYVEAGEIWFYKDQRAAMALQNIRAQPLNSPSWHACRAWLCGIPNDLVDIHYHEIYGEQAT